VREFEVLTHPFNKVVLEGSFDELVQYVGGKELVNVGTRKVVGEGL
jgi:hypothetical protein